MDINFNEIVNVIKILENNDKIIIADDSERIKSMCINSNDIKYYVIDKNSIDANIICSLYSLYDFSDKVTVISDSTQFGGIQNFISTGLLTPSEAVKAVLHK